MKKTVWCVALCLFVGLGTAQGQDLRIDFSLTNGPVEEGYQAYRADHEVPATFTAQSFTAFGTTVTLLPTWAAGATAAAMQMIERPDDDASEAKNLVRDWIGTDGRQPGDPMTLTISGLPAGTYTWVSLHHDPQDQTGIFNVTVNDAAGSNTTTGIDISDVSVLALANMTTFAATIISNGTNPVSLVFTRTSPTDPVATAFFVMNSFELTLENTGGAMLPSPADQAVDVLRLGTVLSWTPGLDATAHDVYLGTAFADVDNAGRANPMGVLASQGQTTTEFSADAPFEFGQTYYWRIDEVNGAPDNTVFKGQTWSFTVEPFAYAVTPVAATASSAQPGMGPENTVNGSGLNAADQHSTELTDMWTSEGVQPNWIQYEFDKVYKLYELRVWNSNQLIETFLGFGAKDVTIEYSVDGQTWTALEGVPEFAKATATADYAANTTVDLAGVMARFVKLTINANWGGMAPQTGLAEVRFFHVPAAAREPQPAAGATDVSVDTDLNWRPGREAESHEVSFGTDPSALTLLGTVTDHVATPAGLEFATTYHWKVNEIGGDGPYEGEVWSFTTQEYAAIDNMESYNDDDNRIYDSWIDGWVNNTGSQVGYDAAPFVEHMIVHTGRQAMPLQYDNTAAPFLSEADHTFASAQDWTANGADTLSLYFRGAAPAAGDPVERLYVIVKDSAGKSKTIMNPDAAATTKTDWQEWRIPLSEFSSAGVKVTAVKAITIGVGNKTSPAKGGAGIVYIDDVRIGRRGSSDPGTGVAYYALENDVLDGSGNGRDGTVFGDPVYVDGPAGFGKALQFSAAGQYVDLGTWNPSAATGLLSVSLWAKWAGLTANWQGLIGKRDSWAVDDMMWQIEANQTTGVVYFQRASNDIMGTTLPVGEWTHVVGTFDGATARLLFNGVVVGQGAFSLATDTEAAFQFGASVARGGNPFNGVLDDIRLYDRVLSSFEISYLGGSGL